MRRAVITGIGVVSSIGNNKEEVLESLKQGRSGIAQHHQNRQSTAQPMAYFDLQEFSFVCPRGRKWRYCSEFISIRIGNN